MPFYLSEHTSTSSVHGRHVALIKSSGRGRGSGVGGVCFACNRPLRTVILLSVFDGWEVCQRARVCVCLQCQMCTTCRLRSGSAPSLSRRASWWQTGVISLSSSSSAVQCTCFVVLKYFYRPFPTGFHSLVQYGFILIHKS